MSELNFIFTFVFTVTFRVGTGMALVTRFLKLQDHDDTHGPQPSVRLVEASEPPDLVKPLSILQTKPQTAHTKLS